MKLTMHIDHDGHRVTARETGEKVEITHNGRIISTCNRSNDVLAECEKVMEMIINNSKQTEQ